MRLADAAIELVVLVVILGVGYYVIDAITTTLFGFPLPYGF